MNKDKSIYIYISYTEYFQNKASNWYFRKLQADFEISSQIGPQVVIVYQVYCYFVKN